MTAHFHRLRWRIKGGAASWQIGAHEPHVEPGFTDSKGLDESLALMERLRPFV